MRMCHSPKEKPKFIFCRFISFSEKLITDTEMIEPKRIWFWKMFSCIKINSLFFPNYIKHKRKW